MGADQFAQLRNGVRGHDWIVYLAETSREPCRPFEVVFLVLRSGIVFLRVQPYVSRSMESTTIRFIIYYDDGIT